MSRALSDDQVRRYRANGWIAVPDIVADPLLAPLREVVRRLRERPVRAERLSGVHNPYGVHACRGEAWKLLDVAESPAVLDSIECVLGPDLVLWDSSLSPGPISTGARIGADDASFDPDEARFWPVDPLAGALALLAIDDGDLVIVDITRLAAVFPCLPTAPGPLYALRYMPASSLYNRDPLFAPNRRAALERPLINYTRRPIWLVRGEDRAGSDFATGFSPSTVRWAGGVAVAPTGADASTR